jgi:molecular chaperone GrpE
MPDLNDELNNLNNPETEISGNDTQEIQTPIQQVGISDEYKERYDDLQNKYLRLYADYENYKKEISTQKTQDERRTKKNVILTVILPLLDHLKLATDFAPKTDDLALAKYVQSVENILKSSFEDVKKIGAEIIMPNIKDLYDQNVMEAIQVLDKQEDYESHSVVKVISFGLKTEGIVIQPARVIITQ